MPLRPLLDKLTPFFPDRGTTCVKNALIVALALLQRQTLCLNKLKRVIGAITGARRTAADSHYKRLIRFFDAYAATDLWLELVACALRLLRLDATYLILDGTSWKGGGHWHHLLTLAVVYRGVAIPILWVDLAKRGTSSYAERTGLLHRALERFDLRGKCLLADREYIGSEWFNYLIDNGLDFCIRTRDRAYFPQVDRSGPGQPALRAMLAKVKASRVAREAMRRAFHLDGRGERLWFVAAKNPEARAGEPEVLLLVTTVDECPYRTVATYLKRWKVEHCFRHLKSNGFDLEAVNLATAERRRLLVAVTVFAYVVSCVEGLRDYRREVRFKRHGPAGRRYRATSVFRYGLDGLSAETEDIVTFCRYLVAALTRAIKGYRTSTLMPNV